MSQLDHHCPRGAQASRLRLEFRGQSWDKKAHV